MSYITIASELLDIITTVKNVPSAYLSEVFWYDPGYTDDSGFPYACIINRGGTEEHLDTATNQTLYRFSIRVCDVNKDKAQTETTIRSLVDEILAELRKRGNLQLGGAVDRVLPFEVTFWWENGTQTPMRYAEIQVEVLMHHSID